MLEQREEQLYKALDDLGIQYEKFEHQAFLTCAESGTYYDAHDMGVNCRNAFMQNRRGKKHYLVVMCADKQIDIPRLAEFLGEHRKMGFASEERLQKYLGLTPGSVTPFGILHEGADGIPVVVDKEIFDHEYVHFHPLRNTASLKITTEDFKKFLTQYACDFLIYDTRLGQ